ILHACELHTLETLEFANNRRDTFQSLSDECVWIDSPEFGAQGGLKGVYGIGMRRSPIVEDVRSLAVLRIRRCWRAKNLSSMIHLAT
ncbi:MAG: hypothetical protein U9Q94_07350, partial [Candidatus Bipolaricaulota bacterium]|nr:hypothetical protein [Candidatus Bipolaricaulota bacterium]